MLEKLSSFVVSIAEENVVLRHKGVCLNLGSSKPPKQTTECRGGKTAWTAEISLGWEEQCMLSPGHAMACVPMAWPKARKIAPQTCLDEPGWKLSWAGAQWKSCPLCPQFTPITVPCTVSQYSQRGLSILMMHELAAGWSGGSFREWSPMLG